MDGFVFGLLVAAMAATLVVLFAGLVSMARGGEFNRKHANMLMVWRVGLQATAVLLFLLLVLVLGR